MHDSGRLRVLGLGPLYAPPANTIPGIAIFRVSAPTHISRYGRTLRILSRVSLSSTSTESYTCLLENEYPGTIPVYDQFVVGTHVLLEYYTCIQYVRV